MLVEALCYDTCFSFTEGYHDGQFLFPLLHGIWNTWCPPSLPSCLASSDLWQLSHIHEVFVTFSDAIKKQSSVFLLNQLTPTLFDHLLRLPLSSAFHAMKAARTVCSAIKTLIEPYALNFEALANHKNRNGFIVLIRMRKGWRWRLWSNILK